MPSALESRVERLEANDGGENLILYACSACGSQVPGDEAGLMGDTLPPCTQGLPHSPIPAGPSIHVVWRD